MNTKRLALALAATLPVATGITMTSPAVAQSRNPTASVDLEKVVQGSAAYTAAQTQINTTYAQNLQQLQQLQASTNAQLEPIVTQARAEQAKPTPNTSQLQTLQTQANQIQAQAQSRAQQLNQPIEIARAYIGDQISRAIEPAIAAVARNKKLGMVVSREAVLFAEPASDVTSDVVAELNRSLPQVGIVPPAEWLQQRGIQTGTPAAPAAPQPPRG